MYFAQKNNVNNQYLSNVFCVAKDNGLDIPVYQIDYQSKSNFKKLNIDCKKFALMICGNENHESVEHYADDKRVVLIVKNYPRMLNVADSNDAQAYTAVKDEYDRVWFQTEAEHPKIINIPLGFCNNYNPNPFAEKACHGGFIGQWTKFRYDKLNQIAAKYADEGCPFDFALYSGFGPFVQSEKFIEGKSLTTEVYTRFMSDLKIAFVPGGQSPETFRLCEAAAAGCIVVHDPLPDVWYYKSLPYIPLVTEDIRQIHEYINENENMLRKETYTWWINFASPVAVGKQIAKKYTEQK